MSTRFYTPRDMLGELEGEMDFHLDLEAAQRVHAAQGKLSRHDARLAARKAFGNPTYLREQSRGITALGWFDTLSRDLRLAARSFRRTPAFTAVVVLTLALGVGATAAIYAVVDWLFVRPPAGVVAPGEIRHLYVQTAYTFDKLPALQSGFWLQDVAALREALADRAELAAYTAPESVSVGRGDHGEVLKTTYTTDAYFAVLGVKPARGRFFAADEDHLQIPAFVAILSDHLWRRAFHGRGDIIGRTIVLDQRTFTIIGVAPAGFTGIDMDAADLWLPLSTDPLPPWTYGGRPVPWYEAAPRLNFAGPVKVLARTKAGTDDDQLAQSGTNALRHLKNDTTAALLVGPVNEANGPTLRGPTSKVWERPLPQTDVSVRITSRLMTAMLLLLLISWANVANLLLGRAMQRQREMAIRLALGTSRRQVFGQLATEAVVLATVAGSAAVLIAGWGGEMLRTVLLPGVHVVGSVYDLRVGLLMAVVTLVVALLAAVIPMAQASRPHLGRMLTSTRTAVGRQSGRWRDTLIVVQTGLSMIILIGAGVFLRSLIRVRAVDTGYAPERLIGGLVSFKNPEGRYDVTWDHRQEIGPGLDDVVRRLKGTSAFDQIAIAEEFPMTGFGMGPLRVPGRDTSLSGGKSGSPPFIQVSPDYFATVGQHIIAGRGFTDADRAERSFDDVPFRAAVVNETMARALWPGAQGVGKCIIVLGPSPNDTCTPVVGVVSEAKVKNVIEPPTMMYYLPVQMHRGSVIVARAAAHQEAAAEQLLSRALRERFPSAETPRISSLAQMIEPQLRPWRLGTILFSGCGLLALVITLIGVYGVISYAVTLRIPEMGVRLALGARASDVWWLVTWYGLRSVGFGVLAGFAMSLLTGQAVASVLYDTSPADPSVMIGVAMVLCACAAMASTGPALRAARTSLVEALRAE